MLLVVVGCASVAAPFRGSVRQIRLAIAIHLLPLTGGGGKEEEIGSVLKRAALKILLGVVYLSE
jgi:hypothetical protein